MTSMTTDTDQRHTPQLWVERIERALGGGIDLDPTAAPDPAQHFAKYNITEAMDSLYVAWGCGLDDKNYFCWRRISTAFMNPPYSNPAPFLKCWVNWLHGTEATGITLTLPGIENNKSTQPVIEHAIYEGLLKAACEPFDPINFNNGGKSNNRDSLFLFWDSTGDAANLTRFCEEFEQHGLISYFIPVS